MAAFNIINPYVNEIYALGLNSTIYLYWTGGPDNFNDIIINLGNVRPDQKGTQGQIIMVDIKGRFSMVDSNIKRFEWIIPKDFSNYPGLPPDFYFTPEDQYYFHLRMKQEPSPDWRYSGFFRIV